MRFGRGVGHKEELRKRLCLRQRRLHTERIRPMFTNRRDSLLLRQAIRAPEMQQQRILAGLHLLRDGMRKRHVRAVQHREHAVRGFHPLSDMRKPRAMGRVRNMRQRQDMLRGQVPGSCRGPVRYSGHKEMLSGQREHGPVLQREQRVCGLPPVRPGMLQRPMR